MQPITPNDRDEWQREQARDAIFERYGATAAELQRRAYREYEMGNSLVAYCLWAAARGDKLPRANPHSRSRPEMLERLADLAEAVPERASRAAGWALLGVVVGALAVWGLG